MRASDSDRQRTVDELRRHCAAGRLDVDEYAARIERALGASTLEELDQLRADLPMMRIADPAGNPGRNGVRSDRGLPPAGRLPARDRAAGADQDHHGRLRLGATAVVALTVLVVVSALVVGLAAQWTWAALLLAGWLVGLAQGRIGRTGRPGPDRP